jgi:hypothetical protein
MRRVYPGVGLDGSAFLPVAAELGARLDLASRGCMSPSAAASDCESAKRSRGLVAVLKLSIASNLLDPGTSSMVAA